jgi:hypothetical protein
MRAISFPFRLDGFGKVATTTDMSKIWADRVRAVVSTYPQERLMNLQFGAGIPEDLFASSEIIRDLVEQDLTRAFSTWLPLLKFKGVEIVDSSNLEGSISLQINYEVSSQLQSDSATVYSVII